MVNLIYRSDQFIVTQTYQSFRCVDKSYGSVSSLVDVVLRAVDSEPHVFPIDTPEEVIEAAHNAKALEALPDLNDKLAKIREIFSRQDNQCPLILDDAFLSEGNLAKELAPCVEAFVAAEKKFHSFSIKHPNLYPYFSDMLYSMMGGRIKFSLCALYETIGNDYSKITSFVAEGLNIAPDALEKVSSAIRFVTEIVAHKKPSMKPSHSLGSSSAKPKSMAETNRAKSRSQTTSITEGSKPAAKGSRSEQLLRERLRDPKVPNASQPSHQGRGRGRPLPRKVAEKKATEGLSTETRNLVGKTDGYKTELFERPGKAKNQTTLRAAQQELKGEQLEIAKVRNRGYNHIEKVQQAQSGLLNHIRGLKNRLGYTQLPEAERKILETELSKASKLLDHTEQFVLRSTK